MAVLLAVLWYWVLVLAYLARAFHEWFFASSELTFVFVAFLSPLFYSSYLWIHTHPASLACGIIMLFYFSCSYYVGFNFVGQSSYLSIPVFILSRPACWLVCPFGTLFSPLILTIASTSVHICVYLYPPCTSVLDFRSRLFVFSYLFTFLYSLLHMTYLGRSFFRTPSLF